MSLIHLQALAEHAAEFARTYCLVVEELIRQGVPEDVARSEARATAATMLWLEEEEPEPWESE